MILRKPYAFLIKNFKLIHAIITVCMIYLVYRSYLIFDFIKSFMKTAMLATEKDITGTLFNNQMFILPVFIIILLIVLLVVMFRKKKPKIFYFLNIIFYGITIVIYTFLYSQLDFIETNISELKDLKLISDVSLILLAIQVFSMILSFIRATGIDIKKFDFGKDLVELEVQDEDNEEFEVSVNVETNLIKRNINKNIRYAKYIFIENKFIISSLALIVLAISLAYIYINMNVYTIAYNEKDNFLAENLNIGVSGSFLTRSDSQGNKIIDEKTLLVVRLYVKAFDKKQYLNTAKTKIVLDNTDYYPISIKYKDYLSDLGSVYYNETLSTEFENILLVYEIPTNDIKKDIQFKYINDIEVIKNELNPKYITVNLNPVNLDNESKTKSIKVKEEVILNEDTFNKSSLTINSFEIANEFTLKYKFCITKIDCINSIEYIKPVLDENYDKVLLKINAVLEMDKELNVDSIIDPVDLIRSYGKIVYKINDKTYIDKSNFNEINPKRISVKNEYYMEINKDVLNSEEIYLILDIRNKLYKYKIK